MIGINFNYIYIYLSMESLKKYRNIIGEPGTGIHRFKFKGTSYMDYFITILGAFFLTYVTDIPLVITTIFLLLLGIFSHALFGIETESIKFIKNLFSNLVK
jgi:hypothetical protein